MYYAHGSWIAIVVFGGMFALRALSSQRRRGGRFGGNPMSRSSFTNTDRRGPVAGPLSGPHNLEGGSHAGTSPGWFRDPFFKHEQRYFSGTGWTEHVSDGGVPGVDPPPERPSPDTGD